MKTFILIALILTSILSETHSICSNFHLTGVIQEREKRDIDIASNNNNGNEIINDEPFPKYFFNKIRKVFDFDEYNERINSSQSTSNLDNSDLNDHNNKIEISNRKTLINKRINNFDIPPVSGLDEYQIRIEYIKMQILQKLGLKEPPEPQITKLLNTTSYERFLELQALAKMANQRQEPKPTESNQFELMYIPPTKSTLNSASFNLTISSQARKHAIKQILLNLKIEHSHEFFDQEMNATIVWINNSVTHQIFLGPIRPIVKPVWQEESPSYWTEYDLTRFLVPDHEDSRSKPYMEADQVLVTLENQVLSISDSFVTVGFLSPPPRRKRQIDCKARDPENSNICCREEFKVDFEAFGWDKWIIEPKSYDAYYCKGECQLATARFTHTVLLSRNGGQIKFCCSPRDMSPISIVYVDNNGRLFYKTMENMVVNSCDCA